MNGDSHVGASAWASVIRWALVAVWTFAHACGLPAVVFSQEAASRPNVLFVAIDDLNDWVSCLDGHPQIHTPHLDALAARGVLFTNAHCQAPICNPSRVSLMTGVRPSTSGVYDLPQPLHLAPALAGAVTLNAQFKANGYHVAGRGKIYHGNNYYPDGWDDFQTGRDPRGSAPKKKPISTVPGIGIRDFGPIDLPDDGMGDMMNVIWATEQLAEKHERPFFLAVGIRLPHVPLYAPRKYFEMFPAAHVELPPYREDDLDDLPPAGRKITEYMYSTPMNHRSMVESNNWHNCVSSYLACTTFVDVCLGRLVDALDRSQYANNTVVVVWSDHGWHLGEKHHWAKRSLWEESTRVPLVVVAPGTSQAGGRCARPVELIDLYPTLVELCDLPAPPQQFEGRSLVSLLKDPTAKWRWPAITTFNRGDHTIRSENWRYIRYANGDEELYDHRKDPNEWTNLAGDPQYEEVIARHARWLPEHDEPDAPRGGRGN